MSKFRTHPSNPLFLVRVFQHSTSSHFPQSVFVHFKKRPWRFWHSDFWRYTMTWPIQKKDVWLQYSLFFLPLSLLAFVWLAYVHENLMFIIVVVTITIVYYYHYCYYYILLLVLILLCDGNVIPALMFIVVEAYEWWLLVVLRSRLWYILFAIVHGNIQSPIFHYESPMVFDNHVIIHWIGYGNMWRETPCVLVKTIVSCRFPLKPIQWTKVEPWHSRSYGSYGSYANPVIQGPSVEGCPILPVQAGDSARELYVAPFGGGVMVLYQPKIPIRIPKNSLDQLIFERPYDMCCWFLLVFKSIY